MAGWLKIGNEALEIFGEPGAEALKHILSAIRAVTPDGVIDTAEFEKLLGELEALTGQGHSLPAAALLLGALRASGDHRARLEWLLQPVSETAGAASPEGRRLSWTPARIEPKFSAGEAITAEFSLDASASLFLEIAKARQTDDAPYLALAGVTGQLGGKLTLGAQSTLKALDTASFTAEARAQKDIRYACAFAKGSAATGTALLVPIRRAAAPPFDLEALSAAFGEGLTRLTIEDTASAGASARLTATIPLMKSAILLGGALQIELEADYRRSVLAKTEVSADPNGEIRLETKRVGASDYSRELTLGLELRFAAPDLLTKMIELAKIAEDQTREYLEELAKAADLREEIESAVADALKSHLGEKVGETLEAALFEDEPALSDLLVSKLAALTAEFATPWLKTTQTQIRKQVLAWLEDSGLGALRAGDASLSDRAGPALDAAFLDIEKRYQDKIAKLAAKLKNKAGEVDKMLAVLGDRLGDNSIVDTAEALAQRLSEVLEKLLERIGQVQRALDGASRLTIAAQLVAAKHRRETGAAELSMSFDPSETEAGETFRSCIFAPITTAAALMEKQSLPAGVKVFEFSEAVRLRQATRRAFQLDLAGLNFSSERVLSSDTIVLRRGNQVSLLSAQQAEAIRKSLFKETQSVTASYLFAPEERPDTGTAELLPQSEGHWTDDAVEAKTETESPFLLTIRQSDQFIFDDGEVRSLLSNFSRAELLDSESEAAVLAHTRQLRRQAGGKLQAVIESHFKLSRAQLAACAALSPDEAGLRTAYSRAVWQALPEREREDVEEGLEDRVKSSGEAHEIFEKVLAQYSSEEMKRFARRESKGQRGTIKLQLEAFWRALAAYRDQADSFVDLLREIAYVADRANPIETRRVRVERINDQLSRFARTAPSVLFSSREDVAIAPLALMLSLRTLCARAGAPAPDLFISVEDSTTGKLEMFSELFAGR